MDGQQAGQPPRAVQIATDLARHHGRLGKAWLLSALVMAVFLWMLAGGVPAASAQAPVSGETGRCIQSYLPNATCTAKDVRITELRVKEVIKPCYFSGDTAHLVVQAVITSTATTRYDIGLFIAQNGGSALSGNGCFHDYLHPASQTGSTDLISGWGPFLNADGDACGDMSSASSISSFLNHTDAPLPLTAEYIDLACIDSDSNGFVDPVSTCTSWDNNANSVCSGVTQAVPGTGSKCHCETALLNPPVPVVSRIIVKKTTNPPGSLQSFNFTTTGSGFAGFSLTHGGTFDSGVLAPGSYSVAEVVPAGWALAGLTCTSAQGRSSSTIDGSKATITLGMADTVTCTFTNGTMDIQVAKNSPATAMVGQVFNYTIDVTNNGTTAAPADVILTDPLPSLVEFQSIVSVLPSGSCSAANNTVTCNLGKMPAGQHTQILVSVKVLPTANTSINNTACVEHQAADSNSLNDCGSVSTTVPVSLAYFSAQRHGNTVLFEWSAATETANAGFNLYEETQDGRRRLNEQLVASHAVDSIEPQDYSFEAGGLKGKRFFIEDVDVFGQPRTYGPFDLGETFGARVQVEPIDWKAIRAEDNAKSAARLAKQRVESPDQAAFGPGGYVEFYGQALDTLYSKTNVYTLSVDPGLAARAGVDSNRFRPNAQPPAFYMETTAVHRQLSYSYSSPTADPWYDTSMLAYTTPKTWSYTVAVDNYVAGAAPASLSVDAWGLTSWPQTPDHHLVIQLNTATVADESFDGRVDHAVEVTLPAGALLQGANTLKLTLPGDKGVQYDMINLDHYSVTYPRAFVARNGGLAFTTAGAVVRVQGLPTANVVAYRLTSAGPVRLSAVQVAGTTGAYTATFAGTAEPAAYIVSSVEALAVPAVAPARPAADIKAGTAQYLIISHANFIAGLQPLVQARAAQGLSVKVVDVADVYAQFNHGIFDPQPIRDYIRHAVLNMGTQYVLLVGGDTYDYLNYLNQGSISFIPTPYIATAQIAYTPADPALADVDGDGAPDVALGRFPVRTGAELDTLVAKTLAYDAKSYGRTAVFAADLRDGAFSFSADSDAFAGLLPGWSIQKAYLDQLALADARGRLTGALNGGIALTSYVGHSAPTLWSNYGLFTTTDAAALTNAGKPTVVVQWGCWNTYHVAPAYNTLAHKFLLSGDRGAAAVLGAAATSRLSSEEQLSQLLMPGLVQPGASIGAALQAAKVELAKRNPYASDVIMGWTLLGDPALVVQP